MAQPALPRALNGYAFQPATRSGWGYAGTGGADAISPSCNPLRLGLRLVV
jgi:hypothetical protein